MIHDYDDLLLVVLLQCECDDMTLQLKEPNVVN